ncbi:hypothetical protein LPJ60_004535 [Coemansia sp. RSA 2675]|nr:hypothetical protein LPJ60_004535 [Coemansia sp. RSA 2675]
MVEPVNIGLFTVPENLSHIVGGFRKGAVKLHSHQKDTSSGTMPTIGGHKTLASLLHLSSSSTKSESRAAYNLYSGSLSATARDHSRPSYNDSDGPSAIGAGISMGTCITINVRYVAKDMWRKVTFPPGITVTQARDICMLRFSIWQQTMYQEGGAEGADGSIGHQRPSIDVRSDEFTKSPHTQPHGSKSGATAGLDGIAGGSSSGGGGQNAATQFRDQYGLFWTSSGHWLEADEMLSSYPLRRSDVLELQHVVDFVPLQPEEFKYSYAEGHIFCLHADSATSSSWRLRWAVLRCLVLRLYRQKGQSEADVVIDLSQPFNLTDQGSRSWPRNSSKMNDVVSVLSTLEMPPISLHPEALPGRHVTGDGGILVLQAMTSNSRASSQAHKSSRSAFVFCTSSASEYEVWQHTLRQTQTLGASASAASGAGNNSSHNLQSPNTISSSATLRGGNSHSGRDSSDPHGPGKHAGTSHGHAADASGSRPYVVGQTMSSALSPKINQRPRAPSSSTRHEGYVNRKASDGYGFRRRYCVLTPSTLFGFMTASSCKDCTDDSQLMANCEFAVSLDPSSVTIEAIAWNGRYLLRVFGPDSHCLRDKPRTTSLQPDENARIHCTDILATAAQAAIEQYGSTFGMLPDSRELVRLMVEDHDDGQLWAVGFNSIAGLQITSQAKVIISARRATLPAEPRTHADSKESGSLAESSHGSAEGLQHGLAQLDEGDASTGTTASSSPGVGKQQSLSEFIVSHMDPITGKAVKRPPPLSAPPRRPETLLRQPLASPTSVHGHEGGFAGGSMDGHHDGSVGPKWIPLSIDKYIKEEEERKRSNGSSAHASMAGLPLTASSDGSSSNRVLSSKASNISDNDHHLHPGQSGYGSARPPARFNWFKRRGSTSK